MKKRCGAKKIFNVVALASWVLIGLLAHVPRPEAADCIDNNPNRNAYFGDLHVHTGFSNDAWGFGTRKGPRAAYRFALGDPIELPPYGEDETSQRTVQLARKLDFAAITDHSEYLGPTYVCTIPTSFAYLGTNCWKFRTSDGRQRWRLRRLCEQNPGACDWGEISAWQVTVEAADDFNEPCEFTAFPGYEWTGHKVLGSIWPAELHRNVIFRSSEVPGRAVSFFEIGTPEGLWDALLADCIERKDIDCDALAIPHQPQRSQGRMFEPVDSDGNPMTTALAQLRAKMEPVVEITQFKGTGECSPALGNDEDCAFELVEKSAKPLALARGGLKEGLRQEALIGANPFRFGMIGSTDTHNATPGMVGETNESVEGGMTGEAAHEGGAGKYDATPEQRLRTSALDIPFQRDIEYSAGSLAGIWATENTRDALFDAIQRREVFATSGPRIRVRLFSGYGYPSDLCAKPVDESLAQAYGDGVPMGGELGQPGPGSAKPSFFVQALADPGTENAPGAPLQQVEIVKGWYDGAELHERVVSVAQAPGGDPGIDLATCEPGGGSASLCTVWKDDTFAPDQRAFYYARVLEVPTCRWSTYQCRALGVDCSRPETISDNLRSCCDGTVPETIQERAWSSPIWYRPEATQ